MKNRYLIAYSYTMGNPQVRYFGNIEIESPCICMMEDILNMQIEIGKKYGIHEVIIIGWNKFERPQ
jgi:hypothetical protein